MKKWSQNIFFGILVITFFIVISCNDNNLNGTWEAKVSRLTFSGNNFTDISFFPPSLGINITPIERKGTYSISGDKIEFLYSNGSVEVSSFTRTKNTIIIGDLLYIKINNDPKLMEQQREQQKEQQKERQKEYHIVILRTLANIFGGFDDFFMPEQRRDASNFILYSILKNENSIIQIYTIWNPNELDGMDKMNIGKLGSTDTGQFAISWLNEYGRISCETMSSAEINKSMSWLNKYDIEIEQIENPNNKNIEIRVPIIKTGRVIGGIGCIFIDNTQ